VSLGSVIDKKENSIQKHTKLQKTVPFYAQCLVVRPRNKRKEGINKRVDQEGAPKRGK
jgi:hypothetical protein